MTKKFFNTETKEDTECYLIESEDEYYDLMKILEEQGCTWRSGEKPTEFHYDIINSNKFVVYSKNNILTQSTYSFFVLLNEDCDLTDWKADRVKNKTEKDLWVVNVFFRDGSKLSAKCTFEQKEHVLYLYESSELYETIRVENFDNTKDFCFFKDEVNMISTFKIGGEND